LAGSYFDSGRQGDTLELALRGDWRAATLVAIREEQSRLDLDGVRRVLLRAPGPLDLGGAWALDELTRALTARDIQVEFPDGEPRTLVLVRSALVTDAGMRPAALRADSWDNAVERLGRTTLERVQEAHKGLAFVGRAAVTQLLALPHWRRLRLISIARHVYDTGVTAIPIVALIAFLISVIIAYLSASQLRNYGADIYVVDLITVGVLRELGVLLTAIIVAGRTGSAFAAELGSMKLNEEVDALDAIGVDWMETLVLPRAMGLVIALPLLTVIADLIGMAGGALLCQTLLDMPLQQFINRANEAIAPTTFWAGIVKAPVFAILIATAGTYRGLQVRGSSRELGRLTTVAVVQSIFLVLLADALFAVLFMKIDF
jgi:phospholipid/cholesterol/gamma-HCH transport system permease protein